MSEHLAAPDHYRPGEPIPHPTATTYGTWWATSTAAEHTAAPSGWADANPPATVPPTVEPVTMRVGWLTGQAPGGPDVA